MPRAKRLACLGLLACLLLPPSAQAQRLTLHDAVQAAWERLPDRRAIEGRRLSSAARLGAGGAFFPNAPYAVAGYTNDQVGSGQGYITYSGEVGTPIWLPGQGTALQATARAEIAGLAAEEAAVRLTLAIQVLDLATQANTAANARDVAQRRLKSASALASVLARRFSLGESPQSDVLAADADAASARVILSDAEAQLSSARAALFVLTGIDGVPVLTGAPAVSRAASDQMLAAHPRLVAAERGVQTAQAGLSTARIDARDPPLVGVNGIYEKQGANQPYNARFGVVLRIPFATEARNAPILAAAQSSLTTAEVQLDLARRQVATERRQAEVTLAGAVRSAAAASQAADALVKRRGQIDRAWRSGEMPFIEVARANALSYDAELAQARARTALAAAQQRLRIAVGIVP